MVVSSPGAGLSWYDASAPSPPARKAKAAAPPPPPEQPVPVSTRNAGSKARPARPHQGYALPEGGSSETNAAAACEERLRPGAEAQEDSSAADAAEEPERVRPDTEDSEPVPAAAVEEETPSPAAVAGRGLNVLEVARSVDEATKAKEQLASDALVRARDEVAAKKAALQAQMREQELRLQEEERRLATLEDELKMGCTQADRKKVQELRVAIEAEGRDIRYLEREVDAKRETMRRATDAYVEAEERLTSRRERRKTLEEEMLTLILETGKAKDAKLTDLLMKVPETKAT